jgi:predicted membrane channel-forming protein YqfA (hemolysin III family)
MWNTELISSITLGATATVPIVVAVTQMIKMTGWVNPKYMPFVAIFVGILISFLMSHEIWDWTANILAGILFGLAASGLYSGLKASAVAFTQEKMQKLEEKDRK